MLLQDILGGTHQNIGHKENNANNFALKTLLLSASSDLGISITSSPSMSLSTRSLSDDTMPFGGTIVFFIHIPICRYDLFHFIQTKHKLFIT